MTAFAAILPQEDIADLAVGDLRHWKIWDLTTQVVALYGQKSHDAPLMTSQPTVSPRSDFPPFSTNGCSSRSSPGYS